MLQRDPGAPQADVGQGGDIQVDEQREASYQELIRTMSSETTLRPFNPKRSTQFVSNDSPKGIAASVYQMGASGPYGQGAVGVGCRVELTD